MTTRGRFLPGWGATGGLYRRGLPEGWEAIEPPTFRAGHGDLELYRRAVREALAFEHKPVTLAGHSLGAALAVIAADEQPDRVMRLVLLSPSGLPHVKPLTASARTFAGQLVRGRYPSREISHALANVVVAPRAALRLAREAHDLDLTAVLERVRDRGIPSTVVACAEDRLATPEHCRRLAALLGAELRELHARDGHIWPITEPGRLRRELGERLVLERE